MSALSLLPPSVFLSLCVPPHEQRADKLMDIIYSKLAKDGKDTSLLEEYWEATKARKGEHFTTPPSQETPIGSPVVTFSGDLPTQRQKTHGRGRSLSDGAALAPARQKLSPYHPAWSLTRLLDRFGPLIFPIHRAALLRRRILISCHTPVHEVCDYGTSKSAPT